MKRVVDDMESRANSIVNGVLLALAASNSGIGVGLTVGMKVLVCAAMMRLPKDDETFQRVGKAVQIAVQKCLSELGIDTVFIQQERQDEPETPA